MCVRMCVVRSVCMCIYVYVTFAVSEKPTQSTAATEDKWDEIKQYLDPNPQLRGTDLGRYAPKVRERRGGGGGGGGGGTK